MEALDIYAAKTAGRQAEQHPRLSNALRSLWEAVEALNKAAPIVSTGETRSSRLFASFIETDTAPAWPAVRHALDELFGKTEESKVEGVEAGRRGISLVVRTLSRTVGFEEDVLVLKRWISDLDSAVTAAEQEAVARLAAVNASSSQVVERQPSPANPHSTHPTHSSKLQQFTPPLSDLPVPSTASSSSSSSFAPGPRTASAPAKGKGRARSSPPTAVTITLSDTSDNGEKEEEELQQQQKKRKIWSRSASLEPEMKDEEGKGRGEEVELEKGEGRMEIDEPVESEEVEEIGSRRVRVGRTFTEETLVRREQEEQADEGMESELTELEDSDDEQPQPAASTSSLRSQTRTRSQSLRAGEKEEAAQHQGSCSSAAAEGSRRSGRTRGAKRGSYVEQVPEEMELEEDDTGVSYTPPPRSAATTAAGAILSASFELLPLLPDILTSLPIELLPTLHPPNAFLSYLSAHPSLNLSFTRSQIDGNPQITESCGTSKGLYFPHKNWLCIRPEQNICAASNSPEEANSIKPGQPIVLVSLKEKHLKILKALGTECHADKTAEGAQLFVREGENRWLYKGKYVLAWDGTQGGLADEAEDGSAVEGNGRERDELENGAKEGAKVEATTEPLDRPGGWEGLHDFIKGAFIGHMNCTTPNWQSNILKDWGFKAKTFPGAKRELNEAAKKEKEEEGVSEGSAGQKGTRTRRRAMRYLVLRCVGFDEECFKVWDKRRGKGKKGK